MAMHHTGVRSFLLAAGLFLAFGVGVFTARNAGSASVPVRAVRYSGFLERNGAPANGPVSIGLDLFVDALSTDPVCQVSADTRMVQDGVFEVPLGECTDTFSQTPDVFLAVMVEGVAMPRSAVGSVPYAQVAATVATVPTNCPPRSLLKFNGATWVCASAATRTVQFSQQPFGVTPSTVHEFYVGEGRHVLTGYLMAPENRPFFSAASCDFVSDTGVQDTVYFYGTTEYARRIPVATELVAGPGGMVRLECGFTSPNPPEQGTTFPLGGRFVVFTVGAQ